MRYLLCLSKLLVNNTNLLNPILEMTQQHAASPENRDQDSKKTVLQRLISWLNEHHPEMAVVFYDIGARHGIHYHYRELLQLNQFKVVGFEPDAKEAERLQTLPDNFKMVYPFAVGKAKELRTIHLTRHPGCSSLFPPNQELLAEYPPIAMFEVVGQAEVPTISLDEFVQTHNPPLPDFIKIDTQGAEYDILQGATTVLEGVVGVFLEAHLREMYVGAGLFPDIHQKLKNLGFRLIFCENNPNYAGEILELDVAYVRDVSELASLEKLLAAIVFCLVHNNLEFAGHLVRRSSLEPEAKCQLLEILSQPALPLKWVQNEDNTFNLHATNSHPNYQPVNVGTIQEQWT